VPCVVIPTFWTRRRGQQQDQLLGVYDHPTPIDQDGTLPQCLESLAGVSGLGRIVLIVAATDPSLEHEATDRVHRMLREFPRLDSILIGPASLGSLHRRLEQIEFADMIHGVNLVGYGAVRNVGLIASAVLGCDEVVFLDDDAIVTSPDFLETGMLGLGQKFEGSNTPILAKSGYYTDSAGRYQRHDAAHWSDMFWRQSDAINEALSVVAKPPRLQRSPVAFGGCLALHRHMYSNVSFDPWVLRAEDLDYVINARMHGADVFLDDNWSVIHQPPEIPSPALHFRQDVYSFVYEHRKIEFAKSQVDLRQVTPKSMMPYPGKFIDSSVGWRATVTSLLRALSRPEKAAYLSVARHVMRDANDYARENCQNYFAFQRRWPMLIDRIWDDMPLQTLFTGERSIDRTTLTGRFPAISE
jgi:GT2 family glycosyltransferase